ncbi:MAG TPA: TolC family protein [Candidatus Acidoferrales bacterium]|nr:TolC family protein [Candidatus Acidoferrales bacterium]
MALTVLYTVTHNWNSWEGGHVKQLTDDAYVRGDLTPLSTKVAGIVSNVAVSDYQQVHKGDLLVELEDKDYQAQVAQASAAVEAAKAAIENNRRQLELADARIDKARAGVDEARAQIAAAQAGKDAVAASLVRARSERKRQEGLFESHSTTQQKVEQAVADEQGLAGQYASREADLSKATTSLRSSDLTVETERRQKNVLQSQELQLAADLRAKEAGLVAAQVNLGYINGPSQVVGGDSVADATATTQPTPAQIARAAAAAIPAEVSDKPLVGILGVAIGAGLVTLTGRMLDLGAKAELKASRQNAQQTENDVALKVHELYYKILIAQVHRTAMEARIKASQDLQRERVQQVKLGSTLEQDLIESRAQLLQTKQELLATDLQLSDLKLQLNDAMGLPLTTALDLDPAVAEAQQECQRETCVKEALASHPEIAKARTEVEKAAAAVHLAKVDIAVPDVAAFARYSYANNVPFLARNFGSFGVHLDYDLFDSGRKRAVLREREAQLSQAVSQELLATRAESSRVLRQEFAHGAALSSQENLAIAQELDAKTVLLQSQLDYTEAHDEIIHAMGRMPE